MTPIPKAALPVVEVLRQDVPPPNSLPTRLKAGFGWGVHYKKKMLSACPMGLHIKSILWRPMSKYNFAGGVVPIGVVRKFGDWWDALPEKDAKAACIAIWPDFKVKVT